jgi:arylsulfatase
MFLRLQRFLTIEGLRRTHPVEDHVDRPNILIIKSDQHNARCLGVNGHTQVKTPNLDALAAGGVNFTRAFVQNPICSPSRMCYLTGQYVHNHGVYGLSKVESFPQSLPSMMSVFKAAGYRTGIVGHVHVKGEWLEPHCDQYRDMYTGFVDGSDPYSVYLKKRGLLGLRDDVALGDRSQVLDARPSKLPFEHTCEGYVYKSFREFLDEQPDDQPFIYQMDPLHPHQCYIAAQEFWNLYEGVDLELPPSADEDISSKPAPQRGTIHHAHNYNWAFEPKTYEAGRLRKLRGYYACVSQVDHMVGLALQALRDKGLFENTIVLYCSDHGDFALEHGFIEKAPGISYDAILRTPFIWSWPGGGFTGGTIGELVESVDVFPTMCALTGVEPPDTIDGVDISPMLRGKTEPVRDFVVTEFALSRTIRTKEWKLCHRPVGIYEPGKDEAELYHVSEDPWEMDNLYYDSACARVREELRRKLFDWTLMTSRFGCVLPDAEMGADGKTTLAGLKALLDRRHWNYL